MDRRAAVALAFVLAGCTPVQAAPPADDDTPVAPPRDEAPAEGRPDDPTDTAPRPDDATDTAGDEVAPDVEVVAIDPGSDHDRSVTNATLDTATGPNGDPAVWEATYPGGTGNGYARVQVPVRWETGDEVVYELSLRLPDGFGDRLGGSVDVLRWDNWDLDGETTDHGGVTVDRDGQLLLHTERLEVSGFTTLVGPVPLPEGAWVTVRVEQRLHPEDGRAVSRLYLDGELVGETDDANAFDRPITAVRAGLVAIDAEQQDAPLELRFDHLVVGPA